MDNFPIGTGVVSRGEVRVASRSRGVSLQGINIHRSRQNVPPSSLLRLEGTFTANDITNNAIPVADWKLAKTLTIQPTVKVFHEGQGLVFPSYTSYAFLPPNPGVEKSQWKGLRYRDVRQAYKLENTEALDNHVVLQVVLINEEDFPFDFVANRIEKCQKFFPKTIMVYQKGILERGVGTVNPFCTGVLVIAVDPDSPVLDTVRDASFAGTTPLHMLTDPFWEVDYRAIQKDDDAILISNRTVSEIEMKKALAKRFKLLLSSHGIGNECYLSIDPVGILQGTTFYVFPTREDPIFSMLENSLIDGSSVIGEINLTEVVDTRVLCEALNKQQFAYGTGAKAYCSQGRIFITAVKSGSEAKNFEKLCLVWKQVVGLVTGEGKGAGNGG